MATAADRVPTITEPTAGATSVIAGKRRRTQERSPFYFSSLVASSGMLQEKREYFASL